MTTSLTNSYFETLNTSLRNYDRAIPRMIIDLDLVDQNIAAFQSEQKKDAQFRLVVKSLPSPELIHYILNKMNSKSLMVFHQPFLTSLTSQLDENADVLLGKPMPISTVRYYYQNLPESSNGFDPFKQIQWLADTNNRVHEYLSLAEKLEKKLRLNLEINVGLHRGGFKNPIDLRSALDLIKNNSQHLELSGLMGYDPHVVKIPGILRSQKKSLQSEKTYYNSCKQMIQDQFPELWNDQLTFNGAGSPTIHLHQDSSSPLNDIAAGSCFVKPSSFDIPTLEAYQPACFIATPVLKKMQGTIIPGIEKFKSLLGLLNSKNKRSYFIYGGFWKADYIYPKGTTENQLFGPSTNQSMINVPKTFDLEIDDFVFLRPHQSEFVFLQFGKLLVTRSGKIVDNWSLLDNN